MASSVVALKWTMHSIEIVCICASSQLITCCNRTPRLHTQCLQSFTTWKQNGHNTDSYLVFTNILSSGHRELSSIDISIQSHTLERTETIIITTASVRARAGGGQYTYLGSVGTGQAELNDEDGLGGNDSVRGGVGRRSDSWIRAGLSWNNADITLAIICEVIAWSK